MNNRRGLSYKIRATPDKMKYIFPLSKRTMQNKKNLKKLKQPSKDSRYLCLCSIYDWVAMIYTTISFSYRHHGHLFSNSRQTNSRHPPGLRPREYTSAMRTSKANSAPEIAPMYNIESINPPNHARSGCDGDQTLPPQIRDAAALRLKQPQFKPTTYNWSSKKENNAPLSYIKYENFYCYRSFIQTPPISRPSKHIHQRIYRSGGAYIYMGRSGEI